MFGRSFTRESVTRHPDIGDDRRHFLKAASAAGLGVVGASVLGGGVADAAAGGSVLHNTPPKAASAAAAMPSDEALLTFALNLEYLEAEFFHNAVHGCDLPGSSTGGKGGRGRVIGGRAVNFVSEVGQQLADEICHDGHGHVDFLRSALGTDTIGQPDIDIKSSFTAVALAAGLINRGETFDPYANEDNFLLAAFVFVDVGVTAYIGISSLISNRKNSEAVAGLLAVEGYHAAAIRMLLFQRGLTSAANAISGARDRLDGRRDLDQGPLTHGTLNITPTDRLGIAYSRTAEQVLNVLYLTPKKAARGGFLPSGVNGLIHVSGN